MLFSIRNQIIRIAFEIRVRVIRLRRTLRQLGRPRIGALDHVTIPVRDLGLARRFYCEVLGAAYAMTVDDETFRRFGRPPAKDGGEGSHHISVYLGGTTRVDLFLQRSGQPALRPDILTMRFTFRHVISSNGKPSWTLTVCRPMGHCSSVLRDRHRSISTIHSATTLSWCAWASQSPFPFGRR